jgi:hypothetical protein
MITASGFFDREFDQAGNVATDASLLTTVLRDIGRPHFHHPDLMAAFTYFFETPNCLLDTMVKLIVSLNEYSISRIIQECK